LSIFSTALVALEHPLLSMDGREVCSILLKRYSLVDDNDNQTRYGDGVEVELTVRRRSSLDKGRRGIRDALQI